MKFNGKIAKYSAVAVLVVVVGIWGRGGALLNDDTAAVVPVPVPTPDEQSPVHKGGQLNNNSPLTEPITPERAKLVQTIVQLSAQLVELAPNQLEAANAAAEAQSLRIQRLRSERLEERSKEAKAAYEAALFLAKADNARLEASNAVKSPENDSNADKRAVYTVPFGRGESGQVVANKDDTDKTKKEKGAQYVLRGILDDDNGGFRAIIEFDGKPITVRKGFRFTDGGVVESVERYIVAVRKSGQLHQLQTF